MSAEETTAADHKAASIWHVDRTARVSQLISGDPSDPRALVLVRDNGRNSAFVEIEGTDHPETDPRVLQVEPAPARGWEEGAGAEVDATVVMCTVGSCDMLEEAVRAILAQDHQRFTLVVVDNAPHTGLTREKLAGIDDTRLSIVSASRPGLSRARNRGVLAARGEVIVFTDDDAIVDPHWLTAMIDPFTASPYVAATTGIALPLEQRYAPSAGSSRAAASPRTCPRASGASAISPRAWRSWARRGTVDRCSRSRRPAWARACAWPCVATSSWRSAPLTRRWRRHLDARRRGPRHVRAHPGHGRRHHPHA